MLILQVYEQVSPLNLLTLARLQLFPRVAIKSLDYVLQVFVASDSGVGTNTWVEAVRNDALMVSSFDHFGGSSLGQFLRARAKDSSVHDLITWARASRRERGKFRMALITMIKDPRSNRVAGRTPGEA